MSLDIFRLVKQDLDGRNELGKLTYGKTLTADDKRDFLVEAYQEALDLVVYLRAELAKRDGQ